MLLLVRLILLFMVSFSKNNDNILTAVITSVAILVMMSFSFLGVYKNRLNNILELFFLILLVAISALVRITNDFIETIVTLIMALITFVAIIIGHLYLRLKNTLPINKLSSYVKVMKERKKRCKYYFSR